MPRKASLTASKRAGHLGCALWMAARGRAISGSESPWKRTGASAARQEALSRRQVRAQSRVFIFGSPLVDAESDLGQELAGLGADLDLPVAGPDLLHGPPAAGGLDLVGLGGGLLAVPGPDEPDLGWRPGHADPRPAVDG